MERHAGDCRTSATSDIFPSDIIALAFDPALSDSEVDTIVADLAMRRIPTEAQTSQLLALLDARRDSCSFGRSQLLALRVLRNRHEGPLLKLTRLLELKADWAAALTIEDVQPWYCNHARQVILSSDRPDAVKSRLIRAVNAHQDEMRTVL